MRYLVILAVLLVAGCGQKGALFLPEKLPEKLPDELPVEPLEELPKEQPKKAVEIKPST